MKQIFLNWLQTNKYLLLILSLGLILRIWYTFSYENIYYPDELMQAGEQGFRLVHGYGLVPWEFQIGARSWVLPAFIGGLVKIVEIAGFASPIQYIPVIKTAFILSSMAIVISVYSISYSLLKSKTAALVAAFTTAVWYELAFFSSRSFQEVVATYTFFGSLALVLKKKPGPATMVLSGVLFGLTVMLRFHYAVLVFVFYSLAKKKQSTLKKGFYTGALGIGLLFGLVDKLTWGSWFHSVRANIQANLTHGVSEYFGTSPWYIYFFMLLAASGGLWLLSLKTQKKLQFLWLIPAIILLTHSLLPHKEYRFIFITIPVLIILSTEVLIRMLSRIVSKKYVPSITGILILGLSFLGFHHRLPFEKTMYPQKILTTKAELTLYKQLNSLDDVCGVYDAVNEWPFSGGYFYLGKNVPLYTYDAPPQSTDYINYLLAVSDQDEVEGYRKISSNVGVSLYKRDGDCQKDPHYSNMRKIPDLPF